MNIHRILYGKYSKYIISAVLGIGLASLFRKVCNDRNCLKFTAPSLEKIKDKVFKYDDKCYTYKEENESCNKSKKQVQFE